MVCMQINLLCIIKIPTCINNCFKRDESLPRDKDLQTLLDFSLTCPSLVHILEEFKDTDTTLEVKNKILDKH